MLIKTAVMEDACALPAIEVSAAQLFKTIPELA